MLSSFKIATLKRYLDTIQYICGDSFEALANSNTEIRLDILYDQWVSYTISSNGSINTPNTLEWQTRIDQIWSIIIHILIDSITDTLPIIWAVPSADKLAANKKKENWENQSVHTA